MGKEWDNYIKIHLPQLLNLNIKFRAVFVGLDDSKGSHSSCLIQGKMPHHQGRTIFPCAQAAAWFAYQVQLARVALRKRQVSISSSYLCLLGRDHSRKPALTSLLGGVGGWTTHPTAWVPMLVRTARLVAAGEKPSVCAGPQLMHPSQAGIKSWSL